MQAREKQIEWLLVLLAIFAVAFLVVVYFSVNAAANSWRDLLLGLIPSAIVVLIAVPIVYFFFTLRGIPVSSNQPSQESNIDASELARSFFREAELTEKRFRDLQQAIRDLSSQIDNAGPNTLHAIDSLLSQLDAKVSLIHGPTYHSPSLNAGSLREIYACIKSYQAAEKLNFEALASKEHEVREFTRIAIDVKTRFGNDENFAEVFGTVLEMYLNKVVDE